MTPEEQHAYRDSDAVREIQALEARWRDDERWAGIRRDYGATDVIRLRGSVRIEHTIARVGAERLWRAIRRDGFVRTFGALTGAQAVQMVRAGLDAIYVSGWQVAADGNLAGHTYPDQSLYPSNSVPALVRRLNNALLRADQVEWAEAREWEEQVEQAAEGGVGGTGADGGADAADVADAEGAAMEGAASPWPRRRAARTDDPAATTAAGAVHATGTEDAIRAVEGVVPHSRRSWLAPIVADAEAGFGGPIHAFELMRALIEAGASGVHFEDQLAAEKKCGHMGGKVLIPTSQFIRTLRAARLAADVLDVPTLLIARTDALSATLLTSDVDERDAEFLTGERTVEGYFRVRGGLDAAIRRSLAYAPYADLLWFETSKPKLDEARRFAEAIHEHFPGKPLAYNCSPSFNWKQHLDAAAVARFQNELAAMGYRFQFITLAGWHLLNLHTFDLARRFAEEGMPAYVRLQQQEFESEPLGYTATRHPREAGAGYFDRVLLTLTGGEAATAALAGSTEEEQF